LVCEKAHIHTGALVTLHVIVAGQQAKKDEVDKEKSKEKTGVPESQQTAPESPQPKTVSGMCVVWWFVTLGLMYFVVRCSGHWKH